jgi:hypothetical protein
MGGGNWNNDFYEERARVRKETNTPVFKHDVDVRAGRATALHELLDPSKFRNGMRESRDSAEHPNSVPVIVGLDVTGSMRQVPHIVQKNLGKLMTTVLTGGFLPDPQICFVAIGDSHTDNVPLQVGQFESGLQMEDDLTRVYIEGNGGGTGEEGYEMALYFATRHTSTDAWEKRKRKGYLFLTGDELAYPEANPSVIHRIFGGERPTKGVPLSQLVKDAQERYHVFFIIPSGTMHANEGGLYNFWNDLLGDGHVLRLQDPSQICDLIALTIGLTEGTAKAGAIEALSPAVKEAIDPVLGATKAKVADAKKSGSKTARL